MAVDMKATITNRIGQLTEEMNRVANQAAQQAALPYRAAIGELEQLLKSMALEDEAEEKPDD